MFSLLSFISVTGGCSQLEYKKNKSQFEIKINVQLLALVIKLFAYYFVFCIQNKLSCVVVVVLHISPTVPVKYLSFKSFKIFKFCCQTIPNATSVSMLSELCIDFP